jgi:NAD(P)-dependent dehydrogenase (short-subunit alcohol dehydrogenase family)
LEGQVALVSGAGTGIGRATAVALGREGASVTLVGRRPGPLQEVAAELEAAGADVLQQPGDITDAEAAEAMVRATVRRWGRLDVLVNNAGLNVAIRDLERLPVEDWRRVLEVNLTGPYLLTRAALPVMRERRRGTVVNVSSMAGYRAAILTGPAYSAAKAGLNSFTDSINLAERDRGIRACTICPGEVHTPIMEQRPRPPSPAERATMLQPEDVAETIALVAALPDRAAVELVLIRPTQMRDRTADERAAAGRE